MIAISYRREDSQPVAGRLYDRLQARFGKQNVFMDFDSIPPGVDFREQIKRTIERSNLVIAVIGPRWLGEQADSSRRIDDPTDFVRLEIKYALEKGIPVIPLLVDNTVMPKPETLPAELEALAFRNALPLDSGMDFHTHAERLINGICSLVNVTGKRRDTPQARKIRSEVTTRPAVQAGQLRQSRIPAWSVFGVIAAIGVALSWWFLVSKEGIDRFRQSVSIIAPTPVNEQPPADIPKQSPTDTNSVDTSSRTSSEITPRVAARIVRTGSFHMTSMETIFAVRGVFDGTYELTEDDIELRITRAVIEVNGKYKRRQVVSAVLFSLGFVSGRTIWPIGDPVQAFSVNKEMGPGEKYYPEPFVIRIPVPQSTDLSTTSLAAQIFSEAPGEEKRGGNCTVISYPGVFAPATRRSEKSR